MEYKDYRRDLAMKQNTESDLASQSFESDPNFPSLPFGLQYMMKILPQELDEPAIYLCGLPFCDFRGQEKDLKGHTISESHLKGYLDVNGVLEDDEEDDVKIQDLYQNAKYLHGGDTGRIKGKNPKLLIKRVINSFEYEVAISGYPTCHRRFAQDILKEKARKLKNLTEIVKLNMSRTYSPYLCPELDLPLSNDSANGNLASNESHSGSSTNLLTEIMDSSDAKIPSGTSDEPEEEFKNMNSSRTLDTSGGNVPDSDTSPKNFPSAKNEQSEYNRFYKAWRGLKIAPSPNDVITDPVGIFRKDMKELVLRNAAERKIEMEKIETIVTKVCMDEMCIHKYLGGTIDDIKMTENVSERILNRLPYFFMSPTDTRWDRNLPDTEKK